jgi:hypothetical protein
MAHRRSIRLKEELALESGKQVGSAKDVRQWVVSGGFSMIDCGGPVSRD